MKSLNTLVKDIERDLVVNLTLGVKHKRVKLKDARDISREFMASYPYKNKKELFDTLYKISEEQGLARKVYVKHIF